MSELNLSPEDFTPPTNDLPNTQGMSDEAEIALILDIDLVAEDNDFLTQAEADNPPDSSPDLETETKDAEPQPEEDTNTPEEPEAEQVEEEPEAVEETEETQKDPDLIVEKETDGKKQTIDFTTAPEQIRAEVKQFAALKRSFLKGSADFEAKLKELSPSSFEEHAANLVQKSAESNPKAWAEYLADTNRDTAFQAVLAKVAADGDDFSQATPELLAELYRVYTNTEEDNTIGEELRFELSARSDEFKLGERKPKLPPEEQAELKTLREERQAKEAEARESQKQEIIVTALDKIIEQSVHPALEKLGLVVKETDAEDVKRNKQRLLDNLFITVDKELANNPETKEEYKALFEKAGKLDSVGAINLVSSFYDLAESTTNEFLSFINSQSAVSVAQKHTPAKQPPKTIAATAPPASIPKRPKTMREGLEDSDAEFAAIMGLGSSRR